MEHQTIFSPKYIKRKIDNFLSEKIKEKDNKIKAISIWQENIDSGKIIKQKEEELQSLFLYTFFGDILGYDYKNSTEWNLSIETRTQFDAKKSDGALGYFKINKQNNINQDIRAVIELKNARTSLDKPQNRKNFKGSPVEQAFMYASKVGESCKWVIVSNFLEIRLYQANDINKYESFNIAELTLDYEFARFYYLFAKGRLFLQRQNSVIEIALAERIEKEQKISNEFYAEYKTLREFFVQHLIIHNKGKHKPIKLLEFAQTIIDRIIFISVIKDYNLISHNIISIIENTAANSFEKDGQELWRQIKKLFIAMDEGMPPRIHKFNGGLFKKNVKIDNLIIKDKFLKYLLHLSRYDFESELSINILGHIFEQSIADIEKLKIHIQKNNFENLTDDIDTLLQNKIEVEKNERKKYGIYYTPEHITKYIVKETVGTWLDEKKEKIGLNKVFDNDKETDKQLKLWYKYAEILRNIKILDPACGSGAFLTQTYDFLFREWQILIDIIQKIEGILPIIKTNGSLNIQTQYIPKKFQDLNIKKDIVSNNIFGIDINNESIEITKLGLWLKTASKKDSLAVLESNIKTGNSLIDDKKVASEKAFVWEKEFKKILNNGGFDIIIGNPPYIRPHKIADKEKVFLWNKYKVASQKTDIYSFFLEKGIELTNENGFLSYIIPKTWMKTYSFKKLRKYILDNSTLKSITLLPKKVFEDATVETMILKLKKGDENSKNYTVNNITKPDKNILIPIADILKTPYNFITFSNPLVKALDSFEDKIENHFTVKVGIVTGNDKKYIKNKETSNIDKPYVKGADINRYFIEWAGNYIHYDRKQIIADGNAKPKSSLKQAVGQSSPKKPEDFNQPKVILRNLGKELTATYDTKNYYVNVNVILIQQKSDIYDLKILTAILNSDIINTYIKSKVSNISFNTNIIKQIPLPSSDFNQKEIITLVDKILLHTKQLYKEKNTFTEIIKSKLKIKNLNKKIKLWYLLDWDDFNTELEKLKVKLSLKKTKEWNEFFNSELDNIKLIILEINKIEEKINKKINKLYKQDA